MITFKFPVDKVLSYVDIQFYFGLSTRCQDLLAEFLAGIKNSNAGVKFEGMANILIVHCNSDGKC